MNFTSYEMDFAKNNRVNIELHFIETFRFSTQTIINLIQIESEMRWMVLKTSFIKSHNRKNDCDTGIRTHASFWLYKKQTTTYCSMITAI